MNDFDELEGFEDLGEDEAPLTRCSYRLPRMWNVTRNEHQ